MRRHYTCPVCRNEASAVIYVQLVKRNPDEIRMIKICLNCYNDVESDPVVLWNKASKRASNKARVRCYARVEFRGL